MSTEYDPFVNDDTTLHKKRKKPLMGVTSTAEGFMHVVEQRMVRTHDVKGLAYSSGNRATRRASLRFDRGDNKHPKQYHKPGHKLY